MILRRVQPQRRRTELLGDNDPVPVEIDPIPAQRVKLPRPQTRERRDLQPRRERRTRQPPRVLDQLPHLPLTRWLLVTPALAP